jgi:hypothetical protein
MLGGLAKDNIWVIRLRAKVLLLLPLDMLGA